VEAVQTFHIVLAQDSAAAEGFQLQLNQMPSWARYAHIRIEDPDTPAYRAKKLGVQGPTCGWLQGLIDKFGLATVQSWPCPFVHLQVWNVPVEGPGDATLDLGALQGTFCPNSADKPMFYPPSPPPGDPETHHYQTRVILTAEKQSIPCSTDWVELPASIQGKYREAKCILSLKAPPQTQ
jgi:phosphatidylethanolamine-binding protein (PEBP) family uncharacterized protein